VADENRKLDRHQALIPGAHASWREGSAGRRTARTFHFQEEQQ